MLHTLALNEETHSSVNIWRSRTIKIRLIFWMKERQKLQSFVCFLNSIFVVHTWIHYMYPSLPALSLSRIFMFSNSLPGSVLLWTFCICWTSRPDQNPGTDLDSIASDGTDINGNIDWTSVSFVAWRRICWEVLTAKSINLTKPAIKHKLLCVFLSVPTAATEFASMIWTGASECSLHLIVPS